MQRYHIHIQSIAICIISQNEYLNYARVTLVNDHEYSSQSEMSNARMPSLICPASL